MASNGIFEIVPGKNHRDEHIFSVIVKRTYRIVAGRRASGPKWISRFAMIDHYYDDGDPEWSTVQYESELAPYKVATDVVVIGKAYAPRGRRDGADDGRRAGGRAEEGPRRDRRPALQLPRGRAAGVHRSGAVHRDGDSLRPRVRRPRREEPARYSVSCIRATSWAPASCCAT